MICYVQYYRVMNHVYERITISNNNYARVRMVSGRNRSEDEVDTITKIVFGNLGVFGNSSQSSRYQLVSLQFFLGH